MPAQADIHAATLRAHRAVEKLDKASLADLIAVYRDAAAAIAEQIKLAGGYRDLIEYAQLQSLRAQVDRILTDLETQRNAMLNRALNHAAQLGATPWDPFAVAQGLETPVSAAAMRVSQEAVRFVTTFIAKDGLQLSDRLWRIDNEARQRIGNAITRAVVSGQGAAEAARDLLARGEVVSREIGDKLRDASAAKLSNQIRHQLAGEASPMTNALRVMRTEINRAHGEAYMAGAKDHPQFAGFKFLLSPAHPAPDICDLLSTQNLYGLGPGVYPDRESIPWPAHPNTLSFIQMVFIDEISAADRAGKETEAEALAALSPERRAGVFSSMKSFRKFQGDE